MKYFIAVLFSVALFSCNNEDKQDEPELTTVEADTSEVKTGTELPETTITLLNNSDVYRTAGEGSATVDWNSFKLTKFWTEDSLLIRPFQPDAGYYETYGRFLIYSPDSSHFIDLDSYNLEIRKSGNGKLIGQSQGPDTEISLVNKKKNEQTRLLFFGPGSSIEDAKWIDNQNLLLIGTLERNNEGHLNAGIFKYNIPSKSFQVYESSDQEMVNHLKGYSKRERLKSVSIQ